MSEAENSARASFHSSSPAAAFDRAHHPVDRMPTRVDEIGCALIGAERVLGVLVDLGDLVLPGPAALLNPPRDHGAEHAGEQEADEGEHRLLAQGIARLGGRGRRSHRADPLSGRSGRACVPRAKGLGESSALPPLTPML